jgi:hypothetical protein
VTASAILSIGTPLRPTLPAAPAPLSSENGRAVARQAKPVQTAVKRPLGASARRGGSAKPVPPPRFDLVPASRILGLVGDITEAPDGDPQAWLWRSDPRAPAPTVIAVDVGADAAIALLSDARAAVHGFRFPRLDGGTMHGFRDVGRWLLEQKLGERVLVVVEDVFQARGPKANPSTSAGLSRRVGALVWGLSNLGPVCRVLAVQWQSDMIGKATRNAGKQRSLDVARARFPGLGVETDHEADAVLLGLWARGGRMPKGRS